MIYSTFNHRHCHKSERTVYLDFLDKQPGGDDGKGNLPDEGGTRLKWEPILYWVVSNSGIINHYNCRRVKAISTVLKDVQYQYIVNPKAGMSLYDYSSSS